MGATTKAMLEATYGVTVYTRWHLVPPTLHTRSWYAEKGIKIPRTAKPDAVKGGGQTFGRPRVSFLFSERKYGADARNVAPALHSTRAFEK